MSRGGHLSSIAVVIGRSDLYDLPALDELYPPSGCQVRIALKIVALKKTSNFPS